MNLAFVTGEGAGAHVDQTRAGAGGGQLWIGPGETLEQEVSLDEAGFAAAWALQETPDAGAARPPVEELQDVRELRIRVYLGAEQLPAAGGLYLDGVRIR